MRSRPGAIHGASPEALVDTLAQRPLSAPPRRVGELTRWQAFGALWQQEWNTPESRDERRWHWLAAGVSGAWHLGLMMLLVWLMYLDLTHVESPPPKGEEMVVVQVEYVGDGTPADIGGGPEPEPVEQVEPDRPVESRPPSPAVAREAEPVPKPEPASVPIPDVAVLPAVVQSPTLQPSPAQVVQRDIPQPEPRPEVVQQPLAVSEPVPDRSQEFVLPATTPRIEAPTIPMPELTAPTPTVEIVEIVRVPRPVVSTLPSAPAPQPVLQATVPEVNVREIAVREQPAPPRPPTPEVRAREVVAPSLVAKPTEVREREIPSPPAPMPPAPVASTPAPAPAAPANPAAETPAPAEPEPEPVATTAGPEKAPAPGAWPSPERADDWGAAERDTPGAQRGEPPGLYNSDGSVRLAETPGSASPGMPPGTITEEIADLDRVGTWLRRPPNDYEPTAFDQYWRPNESLLEEWVRKSINTIRIPIPGTNKYIECTTVLLVMGGGCGIGDPNLNEQPATARPPPDVPFKPELQEGNGSVPPPAG
ncbi:MAG: hypothetical protein ACREO4_08060 [Lysobacter sp.]